jgi:ubiquinol-cytochrome c reductase cytochrome c subunit
MIRGVGFLRAGANHALAVAVAVLLVVVAPAAVAQESPPAGEQPVPASVDAAPEGETPPGETSAVPPGDPAPPDPAPPDPAEAPQADPYAALYLRICAGCHTIGGGPLTGPDLLPSMRWPREDLRVAVKRMEVNVGPMTDEEVDGLTDLLKSPDVQEKLAAASEQRVAEMAASLDPGVPATGRRLFFGERRFANGGVGCFACHAAAGRGGNMARDLTDVHGRMGEQSVRSATEQPAFPMMRAAYGSRPVTAQESAHLAAYFAELTGAAPLQPGAQPAAEPTGILHAAAGGFVILVFGGVALLARSRRAGVRSRLVRDSFRR